MKCNESDSVIVWKPAGAGGDYLKGRPRDRSGLHIVCHDSTRDAKESVGVNFRAGDAWQRRSRPTAHTVIRSGVCMVGNNFNFNFQKKKSNVGVQNGRAQSIFSSENEEKITPLEIPFAINSAIKLLQMGIETKNLISICKCYNSTFELLQIELWCEKICKEKKNG